jgi:hypothetical protein
MDSGHLTAAAADERRLIVSVRGRGNRRARLSAAALGVLDMTTKTTESVAMESIQQGVHPLLKNAGFRVAGRTLNRITPDGLTQVIGFQMGSFDPPGTTYIPGLRENRYGRFTVNLGLYVPEVARHHGGGEAGTIVQDYHCCVRARLGQVGPENAALWWPLSPTDALRQEICDRLTNHALPFLAKFESRDAILREWAAADEDNQFAGSPPRIVKAIILVERGLAEEARTLLAAQAQKTQNPGHPAYVRALAQRLGVGSLDA